MIIERYVWYVSWTVDEH